MKTLWIPTTQPRQFKTGSCTEVTGIGHYNETGVFYWSTGQGRQFVARFQTIRKAIPFRFPDAQISFNQKPKQ